MYIIYFHAGEELCRLQKDISDFTFELTQLQSQLDSVHREKSMLQSKQIEMERMHIQMKEAMSADVRYLRRLNMQLVEQQMKGNNILSRFVMASAMHTRLFKNIGVLG